MLIGYLNLPIGELAGGVSVPQNALLASGAARLFIDIDTGNSAAPQLELALAELQRGDSLISLSLHTLARTIDGLLRVNAQTEARGVPAWPSMGGSRIPRYIRVSMLSITATVEIWSTTSWCIRVGTRVRSRCAFPSSSIHGSIIPAMSRFPPTPA